MTFAQEIEHIAQEYKECPLTCVIGQFGWNGYKQNERGERAPTGETMTWEEARPFLDYNYDDNFGAPECHAVYVWTKNYILFVSTYDGATNIEAMPRNPMSCKPKMFGG